MERDINKMLEFMEMRVKEISIQLDELARNEKASKDNLKLLNKMKENFVEDKIDLVKEINKEIQNEEYLLDGYSLMKKGHLHELKLSVEVLKDVEKLTKKLEKFKRD